MWCYRCQRNSVTSGHSTSEDGPTGSVRVTFNEQPGTSAAPVGYIVRLGKATGKERGLLASLMESQAELLFEKVSKIDGIISTETSLMVKLVKDKHDWGTAWDKKAKPHSRINRTAKDR